jgi:hypothetical protein
LVDRARRKIGEPALAEKGGSRDQHHHQREAGNDRVVIVARSDEANRRQERKADTEHAAPDDRRDQRNENFADNGASGHVDEYFAAWPTGTLSTSATIVGPQR